MGSSFLHSVRALYFILYDLFSAQRFEAMDAMIMKFRNVDEQYIR